MYSTIWVGWPPPRSGRRPGGGQPPAVLRRNLHRTCEAARVTSAPDDLRKIGQAGDMTDANPPGDQLPDSLTLDEAYRAAFYLVLAYVRRGELPGSDTELLVQYLWTDPARWQDWKAAVRRALEDIDGNANPDHAGRWQLRPDWPA